MRRRLSHKTVIARRAAKPWEGPVQLLKTNRGRITLGLASRRPGKQVSPMRSTTDALTRREFLGHCALAVGCVALAPPAVAQTSDGFRLLRTRRGTAELRGPGKGATDIWGYDGTAPGPILRARRGQEIKVRLVNELPEPTLVHWHGLRIANAMDGVPALTQPPIAPGQSFDYRFAVPDAGTFWYHPHLDSDQLGRGLCGLLIVDETQPVDVDRDVALMLADWRLNDVGSVEPAGDR